MLRDFEYLALEYICLNLRDCDKREIYGMRGHDNPLQLCQEAHSYIRNQGRGVISWIGGKPAAMAAFTEDWPGVWSIWMFGTEDFRGSAIELMRWVRKEGRDILSTCAGHRLQCDSMAEHLEGHKLIEAMGGLPEHRFRRYGKNQEDYIRYVWLQDENNQILSLHYQRPEHLKGT